MSRKRPTSIDEARAVFLLDVLRIDAGALPRELGRLDVHELAQVAVAIDAMTRTTRRAAFLRDSIRQALAEELGQAERDLARAEGRACRVIRLRPRAPGDDRQRGPYARQDARLDEHDSTLPEAG